MIGLDTNVLVRYIVQDDPRQSARAGELIEQRLNEQRPGFVSLIVVVELVWVLGGGYGYSRQVIAEVLTRLLGSVELSVERADRVWNALLQYRNGSADFADYMIGACARAAGCETTMTFDQKAARSDDFELLDRH